MFTKGGDFAYDNGTITGEECEECGCGDLADVYGGWSISNDVLTLTAKGRIDDGVSTDFDEIETFMVLKIKALTAEEMTLTDPSNAARFMKLVHAD